MFFLFSKVPLYIPNTQFCWRVLFSNPLAPRRSKHADEYILIVPVKFVKTCQTMFIINPQVVNYLNNQNYFNRTIAYSIERKKNKERAHSHTRKPVLHDSIDHLPKGLILRRFSENKPETMSKDCWHLVESIGTAIWAQNPYIVNRLLMENHSHKKSYVILTEKAEINHSLYYYSDISHS